MRGRNLLVEGVTDAVGFVGGARVGVWLGRLLGIDIFAAGYGSASMGGVLLVGLGGGGRRLNSSLVGLVALGGYGLIQGATGNEDDDSPPGGGLMQPVGGAA